MNQHLSSIYIFYRYFSLYTYSIQRFKGERFTDIIYVSIYHFFQDTSIKVNFNGTMSCLRNSPALPCEVPHYSIHYRQQMAQKTHNFTALHLSIVKKNSSVSVRGPCSRGRQNRIPPSSNFTMSYSASVCRKKEEGTRCKDKEETWDTTQTVQLQLRGKSCRQGSRCWELNGVNVRKPLPSPEQIDNTMQRHQLRWFEAVIRMDSHTL